MSSVTKIQPDWWSKSIAGCLLGFTFALAVSGVFAWVGPGGIEASNKVQFNMWIIAPIWMLILSFSYLFKTGVRAISWLVALNLLAYIILFAVKGS